MISGEIMDINSLDWNTLGPILLVGSLLLAVILSKVFGEGGQ
jgi:hypothetical protein